MVEEVLVIARNLAKDQESGLKGPLLVLVNQAIDEAKVHHDLMEELKLKQLRTVLSKRKIDESALGCAISELQLAAKTIPRMPKKSERVDENVHARRDVL